MTPNNRSVTRFARALRALLLVALAAGCSESSGPRGEQAQVTVTAVVPFSGLSMGGTQVSILGTEFPTTVDSVTLGAGKLSSLVRASSTVITGTAAASAVAGTVDVTVYTTGAGTATCSACFAYVGLAPGNYRFTAGYHNDIVGGTVVLYYANVAITIQHDSTFNGRYTVTDSSWGSIGESFPLSGWMSGESVQFAAQFGDTVMTCYGYYSFLLHPQAEVPPLGVEGDWDRYVSHCAGSRCAAHGIFTLASVR